MVFLAIRNASPAAGDFQGFYDNGLAWRLGRMNDQSALAFPDLNPPTFAILISPLTYVPVMAAFQVWTAIGAVLVTLSLRSVFRARPVSLTAKLWTIGAFGALMPCLSVWIWGQVSWVLLYLVTRAWLARSPRVAGLWLGAAIALKPPLALMAILLPWPIALWAGGTSAGITGAVVALTGVARWRDWLALSGRVTWLNFSLNGSLWSWPSRLHALSPVPVTMQSLGVAWSLGVVLTGVALVPLVLRRRGDARWLLACWWSVLVSPLGWVHYLPLAIGPLLSVWRWSVWTIVACAIFVVPVLVTPAGAGKYEDWLIQSLQAIGVLAAWIAFARIDRADHVRADAAAG
jgi:hypothetical protein